jgi:serine/threonine protein kinase
LIQKSGVVDEAKLRAYVQKLRENSTFPREPAKLAGLLVRDAVLTYFQAEQLLQGKYKRFSIGKYKVLEKLGAGGMAQVFLCEHKLMRRRVAIKVLPTAKADDPSSLGRFRREAQAVAAVDHPNIVRAYDIDQDDNLHFLVMEYVDGTNLQDLIKKFGPLDVLRACHYIYGAAVGLQHAHEKGLIHRDIKPGNILIDRTGVVKILDLGLARFFHDEEDALTKKYDENVLGTADYLAPEQALDSHTVDIRADIYSLGATFYYLLTASALFPEGSVAQKLIWHQNRQPRPVRTLRPEVPEEIAAIVEKMMAKDANLRYQTPAELLVALAPWVMTPIPPPSERELPQVSPAAGGGLRSAASASSSATNITARSMLGVIPDAPTVVASVPATPTQQIPAISGNPPSPFFGDSSHAVLPLPPANNDPAVWESLDTDTPPVSKTDTDQSVRKPESASRMRGPVPAKSAAAGHSKLPYVIVGLVVLAGGSVAAYFLSSRKTPAPIPAPPAATARTLTVSLGGGELTYPTLRNALSQAKPGDTIVINEPRLTESTLKLSRENHKDLTIESGLPNGKAPVIEFNAPKESRGVVTGAMLILESVEGVRLKNIEFDGKNTIATGVQISGFTPGVTLENISIANVKTGLALVNAAGDSSRPIVVDHLHVWSVGAPPSPDEGCGVLLKDLNADTKWARIRNSRIDGPCKDGIAVEGGTAEVEITGNRFFKTSNAFLCGRPPVKKMLQIQFTNNTIVEARAGLFLDLRANLPPNTPEPPMGKFDASITQNYFDRTPESGKVEGGGRPEGVKTENNASEGGSGGNLGINPTIVPNPKLASTRPEDDDARFLRFTGGQPALPNGVKVGAP